MTQEEIQIEAGILELACAQLGQQLAASRLAVAPVVYRQLGIILGKLAQLEAAAVANAGVPAKEALNGAGSTGSTPQPQEKSKPVHREGLRAKQ